MCYEYVNNPKQNPTPYYYWTNITFPIGKKFITLYYYIILFQMN